LFHSVVKSIADCLLICREVYISGSYPIPKGSLQSRLSRGIEKDSAGSTYPQEALRLLERLQPDVMLLDLRMPQATGLRVLQELADSKSQVRTILLSGVAEGEDSTRAFALGARGLVMKETASSVLFKSILEVMDGQYWVGRQSTANLPDTLKSYRRSAKKAQPQNYGLTSREVEIIKAVASGHSNKRIASEFSISEQTVKHHITSVFDKLGVYNRLELTLFVLHHGIVE
jgi:two-component system, NarL family, nitrate/nitrite response regulator NarL